MTFRGVVLPRIETLDENLLVVAGRHSFPNMARPNLEFFVATKGVPGLAKKVKSFASNDKLTFLEEGLAATVGKYPLCHELVLGHFSLKNAFSFDKGFLQLDSIELFPPHSKKLPRVKLPL